MKSKNKTEFYSDKYKALTYQQVDYLLTGPNTYYFRQVSPEQKADLERLASDNNYNLRIETVYEDDSRTQWKKKGRKKIEGYVAKLVKDVQ